MKTILNVETGETIERELNSDELAQQAIDEASFAVQETEKQNRLVAKQSLLNKLGITQEEANLLLS
jgi:hypothetical protein